MGVGWGGVGGGPYNTLFGQLFSFLNMRQNQFGQCLKKVVCFSGLSSLGTISYEVPWVEPPRRCWGALHSASEGGLRLSTSSAEVSNMVRVIVLVMRKSSIFCVYHEIV